MLKGHDRVSIGVTRDLIKAGITGKNLVGLADGGNPPSDGLTPCALRLGKSHVTPDGARASARLKE